MATTFYQPAFDGHDPAFGSPRTIQSKRIFLTPAAAWAYVPEWLSRLRQEDAERPRLYQIDYDTVTNIRLTELELEAEP